MLASFTSPIAIPTDPWSMLWMFPLLAVIALVYKATKMKVLFLKKYFFESLLLFLTLAAFMIGAIVVLNLLDQLITG
jgi:hypothetical protein